MDKKSLIIIIVLAIGIIGLLWYNFDYQSGFAGNTATSTIYRVCQGDYCVSTERWKINDATCILVDKDNNDDVDNIFCGDFVLTKKK